MHHGAANIMNILDNQETSNMLLLAAILLEISVREVNGCSMRDQLLVGVVHTDMEHAQEH